jgi:hypothetical protein
LPSSKRARLRASGEPFGALAAVWARRSFELLAVNVHLVDGVADRKL